MCLQCLSTYHMRTWSVFQVYKSIITTHQCVYNVCQLITWQHELCVSRFLQQCLSTYNHKFTYNHNPSMCLQCLSTYHLTTWIVCFKVYNSIITIHKCVYNVCQLIIWQHEVFVISLQFYNHNPSMCLQCLSTYHLTTWIVCFKVYNSIITSHKCVYNVCQLIIWEHEVCSKVYKSIITTHQCVYNVCQLITWQHELCVSRFTTR